MAYYVWLNDDFCEPVNGRMWPNQLDVWTDQVEPRIHKAGWQVVMGSGVVDGIPWRHLPATLYRVEVEEPVDEDGDHTAWSRAMLVERYGRLRPEMARQAAIAIMTQIVNYYQHPSFYRGPNDLSRLDECARVIAMGRDFLSNNGGSPLKRAIQSGYAPLIHMARSLEATSDDMAWVHAMFISPDIKDKALKLDMARALSEVLE